MPGAIVDVMKLFRFSKVKRDPKLSRPQLCSQPSDPVRVLGITQSEEETDRLRQIAADLGWDLLITDCLEDALALLHEQPVTTVIYDRDFPEGNWRQMLVKIASLTANPICVLLASSVVDPYLWDEVIRHRGYDVVQKPFNREELRRVVRFASSWREWTTEYHARAMGRSSS